MKIRLCSSLGWLVLLCWMPGFSAAESSAADNLAAENAESVVRIGMVMDGAWELEAELRDMVVREIQTLTEGEFNVQFPPQKYLVADWSLEGAEAKVDLLLADPQVDLLITIGPLSSHLFCCRTNLPKPVIAPIVLDAKLQGVPRSGEGSGVPNLNYLSFPDQVENELTAFREVVPYDHVTILISQAMHQAIPELLSRAAEATLKMGIGISYVPVGDSVDEALSRLPPETDAIYLMPLLHLGSQSGAELIEKLIELRLPSFSALGRGEVEAGILTGLGRDEFFQRLARRVALNVQRILLGEPAETIPVDFIPRLRLVINMETARAIDVSPRWEVLIEADLIGEEEKIGRVLTLDAAVREAVDANLDLLAQQSAIAAGLQDIARAQANFRPQVSVSATGLQIDDDRAEASFGSQPERSLSAGISVSQLIFSEEARANLDIQRDLQFSRELDWAILRLDLARDAAVTYLNLLRAKTLLDVRRNNLDVTRTNLELAELRRSIGQASPAEVYRWESSIAADRQEVVDARAQVHQAEIALNRLLHRDLEEPFRTAEVQLDDPILITGQERFRGYVETPKHFAVLREFSVSDGLELSPELQQVDVGIAVQERQLKATKRSFRLPTVAALFSLDELLTDGGAGSDFMTMTDDTTWSLGLDASLSLYTGGSRRADVLQAEEELERLAILRESTAEKIELSIRSAMVATQASFTSIDLSRQAAEAANKNLDLVSDAYARGAISILDLLDAQNAALNAELNAANAVYDFLIDLMDAQRASNQFDFFITPAARDAWYQRLDQFFAEAGVERYVFETETESPSQEER